MGFLCKNIHCFSILQQTRISAVSDMKLLAENVYENSGNTDTTNFGIEFISEKVGCKRREQGQ